MVRLRDQKIVGLNAELLRVSQVQRMFGIDISSHAALLLRLSYDLQRQGRLTGSFRSIDLDDAAARHTADPQSNIESERTGRDYGDVFHYAPLAELHDRPFAQLPFDLAHGE